MAGDGDVAGHEVSVDVTGGGNFIKVDQSGINDNKVDLDMTGHDNNVNITQSD